MLMDEWQLHEGLLPMLESEEVVEVVAEPSFEGTLSSDVYEAEALTRDEQEDKEVSDMILGEGFEVQPEMEDVGEGSPVTPVAAKVGPSFGMGLATPVLATLGSTPSSRHYSRAKLVR